MYYIILNNTKYYYFLSKYFIKNINGLNFLQLLVNLSKCTYRQNLEIIGNFE